MCCWPFDLLARLVAVMYSIPTGISGKNIPISRHYGLMAVGYCARFNT